MMKSSLMNRFVTPHQVATFKEQFREEQRVATQHSAILQRALSSPDKVGYRRGQHSGRLDRRVLASLATGLPARPFRRREIEQGTDTVVSILVDGSGSMAEDVYGYQHNVPTYSKKAAMAAAVVADAIERGGNAEVEVSAFHDHNEGWSVSEHLRGYNKPPGNGHHRVSPSLLVRYKPYGVRVTAKMPEFTALQNAGLTGTPLAESIESAARLIYARPEQRKILVVWTDGKPNAVYMSNSTCAGREDYVRVICQQCEDAGIEVVLIGFSKGVQAVQGCHWRNATCDVNHLAKTTIKSLVGALLKPYQKGETK